MTDWCVVVVAPIAGDVPDEQLSTEGGQPLQGVQVAASGAPAGTERELAAKVGKGQLAGSVCPKASLRLGRFQELSRNGGYRSVTRTNA